MQKVTQHLPKNRGVFLSSFFSLHSLGYQGESFGADGGTRHQLDHHVFAGRLKMDSCHLLQHGGQGGHVAGLCAGVSSRCVQDVSPVHHQQQHMSLAFFLPKKKEVAKKRLKTRSWERKAELEEKYSCLAYSWHLLHASRCCSLPPYPPVPRYCSEGDSAELPAGRDPLRWIFYFFFKKRGNSGKEGEKRENKKNGLNKRSQQEPLHPAAPLTEA